MSNKKVAKKKTIPSSPLPNSKKVYELSAEFGSVIHKGSKKECELIVKAFATYGMREDKFYIDSEEKFYG
jgi:hypothetical protein